MNQRNDDLQVHKIIADGWMGQKFQTLKMNIREAPAKKTMYIWALPKLRFDPPYCANPGTLWHNFFAENEKILKTAILTLGMNILTVTKVKDDFEMMF